MTDEVKGHLLEKRVNGMYHRLRAQLIHNQDVPWRFLNLLGSGDR